MYFPPESIEKADSIASQIKLRNRTKHARALSLFENNFLELKYGFDTAIRTGRCGTYLHEATTDAECFSLAGMHYLIAKSLGLQPKIYSAKDMYSVAVGQDPSQCSVDDHTFITVTYGGSERLLDMHHTLRGKIEKRSDHWLIHTKKSNQDTTTRHFGFLEELSEQEYVTQMERIRQPAYGKEIVGIGQRITSGSQRVMIQGVEDGLVVYQNFDSTRLLVEDLNEPNFVLALRMPMCNGELSLDQAELETFRAEVSGWRYDQFDRVRSRITLPIALVHAYLGHLEEVAKHHGRRTPLQNTRSRKHPRHYFEQYGVDSYGRVGTRNGVSINKHEALLEEIAQNFPASTPYFATNAVFQQAQYHLQLQAVLQGGGLYLYSESEREQIGQQLFEQWAEDFAGRVDDVVEFQRSQMGLSKKSSDKVRKYHGAIRGRGTVSNFVDMSSDRVKDPRNFHAQMDFALFQRDNPSVGVSEPSDNAYWLHRHRVHEVLTIATHRLKSLQVPKFRKGIEKILSA